MTNFPFNRRVRVQNPYGRPVIGPQNVPFRGPQGFPSVPVPRAPRIPTIPDIRERLPEVPTLPDILDTIPMPGRGGGSGGGSPADVLCWENPVTGETICGASGGSGDGSPSVPTLPDPRRRLPRDIPPLPDPRERLPRDIPPLPDPRERLPDISIPSPSGSQISTSWPNVQPPPLPASSRLWNPDRSNRIVIGLISGLFGHSSLGIRAMRSFRDFLVDYLRGRVSPENIFYLEWNPDQRNNPFAQPDTALHNLTVDRISNNPCYLALIGTSYGGWAVSRLSRRTRRIPDFIGLIDPVYGPTNNMGSDDFPRGRIIRNWYQNNAIQAEPCTNLGIPCTASRNGIACGNSLSNMQRQNVRSVNEQFYRDWNGRFREVNCAIVSDTAIQSTHENIAWNQWIWRQIADQLIRDIDNLVC